MMAWPDACSWIHILPNSLYGLASSQTHDDEESRGGGRAEVGEPGYFSCFIFQGKGSYPEIWSKNMDTKHWDYPLYTKSWLLGETPASMFFHVLY